MGYSVLPTKKFETRLESALTYIILDLANPIAAQALLDAVEHTFTLLATTPFAFPEDEYLRRRTGLAVRKVPVKNYRIYYTVDEQRRIVYPRTFIHCSQDSTHLNIDEFVNS